MENNKIIHYELEVNEQTLQTYGQYVDFIHLTDDKITIRLVLKSQEPIKKDTSFGQTVSPQ